MKRTETFTDNNKNYTHILLMKYRGTGTTFL